VTITVEQLIETHIKTLKSIDEVEQVAQAMAARRAELATTKRLDVRKRISAEKRQKD
jgi:hypothetical protein